MYTLKIEDFKCFGGSKAITLNRLTVLVGMNSAGKSSMIQSMILLQKAYNSTVNELNYNGVSPDCGFGTVHELMNSDSAKDEFSVSLYDDENEKSVECVFSTADDEEDSLLLKFDIGVDGDIPLLGKELYYLSAERLGPRTSHPMVDLAYPHCGEHGEYTAQVLSYKGGMSRVDENRKFPGSSINTLEGQVRAWLDFILPGTSISITPIDTKIMRRQVMITRKTTDLRMPTNVGFGVSFVLPIIVECLVAKKDRLVIIENPEAHLHPSAQTRMGLLLGFMAHAGLTMVIETHSEHVVDGIQLFAARNPNFRQDITINFFSDTKTFGTPDIKEITLNKHTFKYSELPSGFMDESAKTYLIFTDAVNNSIKSPM